VRDGEYTGTFTDCTNCELTIRTRKKKVDHRGGSRGEGLVVGAEATQYIKKGGKRSRKIRKKDVVMQKWKEQKGDCWSKRGNRPARRGGLSSPFVFPPPT